MSKSRNKTADSEPDVPEQALATDASVDVPALPKPSMVAQLQTARGHIVTKQAEIKLAMSKLSAELQQTNGELDRLDTELLSLVPPTNQAEDYKRYLAVQQEGRAARIEAAKRSALVQKASKSPLDSAMAPNRRRHSRRPVYPAIKLQ